MKLFILSFSFYFDVDIWFSNNIHYNGKSSPNIYCLVSVPPLLSHFRWFNFGIFTIQLSRPWTWINMQVVHWQTFPTVNLLYLDINDSFLSFFSWPCVVFPPYFVMLKCSEPSPYWSLPIFTAQAMTNHLVPHKNHRNTDGIFSDPKLGIALFAHCIIKVWSLKINCTETLLS